MMKYLLIVILVVSNLTVKSQKEDYTWTFPNGGGVVFSDTGIVSQFRSSVGGFCEVNHSVISDSSGNLLFYTAAIGVGSSVLNVFSKNGFVMQNGGNLGGNFNYLQGSLLIKSLFNDKVFYLISRKNQNGLLLNVSKIDISINGGSGQVILRDSLFDSNLHLPKAMAIQHGNGKYWWLIFQSYTSNLIGTIDKFLINENGITFHDSQQIGTAPLYMTLAPMLYNSAASQIINLGVYGFIDIFDFDRCTGQLSNFVGTGERDSAGTNLTIAYQGGAVSPNGRYLYTTVGYDTKTVHQWDLQAPDILASKTLVFQYPDTGIAQGTIISQMKLGPDGRIYAAKGSGFNVYLNNEFTQGIDAILYPDSPGVACAYTYNYVKLDSGAFTVYGLPNMPDYRLGRDTGSLCDTISTAVGHQKLEKYITVYPNPSGGVFNIELRQAGDAIRQIKIYNSQGMLLPEQPLCGGTCSTIDMGKQPTGLYYYRCTTTTGKTYTGKLLRE